MCSQICCVVGLLLGLPYVTPGGQVVLEMVDFYAGTLLILALASIEIMAMNWIYGTGAIARDIEFMLNTRSPPPSPPPPPFPSPLLQLMLDINQPGPVLERVLGRAVPCPPPPPTRLRAGHPGHLLLILSSSFYFSSVHFPPPPPPPPLPC